MGKVMAAIREKLTGRIDNAKASLIVKKLLARHERDAGL